MNLHLTFYMISVSHHRWIADNLGLWFTVMVRIREQLSQRNSYLHALVKGFNSTQRVGLEFIKLISANFCELYIYIYQNIRTIITNFKIISTV